MAEESRKVKKSKKKGGGAPDWMVTYGDIMTLLLTFFIMLLSPAVIEGEELRLILANFPGLGNLLGGESFNQGKLPHSGQVQEALPSKIRGSTLDRLKSQSIEALKEEIKLKTISVQLIERGLVVSLVSDIFFEKYSANLKIDDNIDTLRVIAGLIRDFLLENPLNHYRIEGHTDETSLPVGSPYVDEWGLSAERAVSVLRFLEQFLVPVENAQVTGFGDSRLNFDSIDGAGSPFNRRVDIIVINEGNL